MTWTNNTKQTILSSIANESQESNSFKSRNPKNSSILTAHETKYQEQSCKFAFPGIFLTFSGNL